MNAATCLTREAEVRSRPPGVCVRAAFPFRPVCAAVSRPASLGPQSLVPVFLAVTWFSQAIVKGNAFPSPFQASETLPSATSSFIGESRGPEFAAEDIDGDSAGIISRSEQGSIQLPDLVLCGDGRLEFSVSTRIRLVGGGGAQSGFHVESITTGCGCTAAVLENSQLSLNSPLIITTRFSAPPVAAELRKSADVTLHFTDGKILQLRRIVHLFPVICVDHQSADGRSLSDAGSIPVQVDRSTRSFRAMIPIALSAPDSARLDRVRDSVTVGRIVSDQLLEARIRWTDGSASADVTIVGNQTVQMMRGWLDVSGQLADSGPFPATITLHYRAEDGTISSMHVFASFCEALPFTVAPGSLTLTGGRRRGRVYFRAGSQSSLPRIRPEITEHSPFAVTEVASSPQEACFEIRYLPDSANGFERHSIRFLSSEGQSLSIPVSVLNAR